jgi:hypothetical protein
VFGEAHPIELDGDTVTLEFPSHASFHLKLAEDKYTSLLRDAVYEVTGRKLGFEFVLGAPRADAEAEEEPAPSESDLVALFKETFDAREVDE